MCVIVYKNKDAELNSDDILKMWSSNSDGAGLIVFTHQHVKVIKGMMKLSDLVEETRKYKNKDMLLHFRLATHGKVNRKNTHPFPIGKGRWLMHNGILSQYGSHGDLGRSDSEHFASEFSNLSSDALTRLLDSVSGKFAFIDGKDITLHGTFLDYKELKVSNTYFAPTSPRIHTSQNLQTQYGSQYVWGNYKNYGEEV